VAPCSMKAAMAEMEANNIRRVTSADELTGWTFTQDAHCHDLLLFPGELLSTLEQHRLVEQCHLVLQVDLLTEQVLKVI